MNTETDNLLDMEDLKLRFDGSNQIEANTLINSLIHFTTIAQEVNKELETGRKLSIKINALPEGSFVVHFTLDATLMDQAINFLSGAGVSAAVNLADIIVYMYAFVKFKRGKKVEIQELANENGKSIVINAYGDSRVILTDVVNIYEGNKIIQKAISQGFETLENDQNVSEFEILDRNNIPLVNIERSEFNIISNDESYKESPSDRIIPKRANLNIIRASFSKSITWDFLYEGRKISSKITDEDFLAKINNGESFASGDTLEVDLEIRQEFVEAYNNYEDKSFSIKKVIMHHPRSRQTSLELPKS